MMYSGWSHVANRDRTRSVSHRWWRRRRSPTVFRRETGTRRPGRTGPRPMRRKPYRLLRSAVPGSPGPRSSTARCRSRWATGAASRTKPPPNLAAARTRRMTTATVRSTSPIRLSAPTTATRPAPPSRPGGGGGNGGGGGGSGGGGGGGGGGDSLAAVAAAVTRWWRRSWGRGGNADPEAEAGGPGTGTRGPPTAPMARASGDALADGVPMKANPTPTIADLRLIGVPSFLIDQFRDPSFLLQHLRGPRHPVRYSVAGAGGDQLDRDRLRNELDVLCGRGGLDVVPSLPSGRCTGTM